MYAMTDMLDPVHDFEPHLRYGMVRIGRIMKVNLKDRIAAKVSFFDKKIVSRFYPVLQKNTVGCQEYYCPEIGETVWVLRTGMNAQDGLILGAVYTTGNPPPYSSQSIRGIVFHDASFVIYDSSGGGTYQVNIQGKIAVSAVKDIAVTTQTFFKMEGAQDSQIKAPKLTLDADVIITKNLLVMGGGEIGSGTMTCQGDMRVDGHIDHHGDMDTTGVHHDDNGVHH
jgi:phage baseplate assembly protein V